MSKRGAANQLTQDNWDREDGGEDGSGEEDGEFKKAAPEEIAKRRIVKARRGGAAVPDGVSDPSAAAASAPDAGAKAGGFSWGAPAAGDKKDGEAEKKEGEEKEETNKGGGEKEEAKKDGEEAAKEEGEGAAGSSSPEKKPLFNFSGLGSGTGGGFSGVTPTFNFGIKPPASGGGSAPAFSFGSTAAKPFSFAGAGAAPQGGGFSFGNGGLASFSSVGGSGWGTKKDGEKKADAAGDEKGAEKEGGGGGGEGGDDGGGDGGEGEDPEKEVSIRKGDGIVQLEEVETTTGEEEECTVFQVRAKLFTFCKPGQQIEGGEKEGSGEVAVSAAGGKDGEGSWQVTGIGQLKINVPKQEGSGIRPRIIMRRQKTFQVCLNTYLFETMVCDKAGPKDIRFTGMKSDSDTELATYLLRVKEEDAANDFVAKVKEYAVASK